MTTTGTTFDVSRVSPATEPLPEVPYLQAVAALLGEPGANLSEEDLDRLSHLIDQARKEGR